MIRSISQLKRMGNAIVRLDLVLENVHIGIFRMCISYMPLRYLNVDPSEFSRINRKTSVKKILCILLQSLENKPSSLDKNTWELNYIIKIPHIILSSTVALYS